jgi:hypothetical protein
LDGTLIARYFCSSSRSFWIYTSYGCPVVYLCCDEGQGMEFNLTLKSSREPASTTEDGNLLPCLIVYAPESHTLSNYWVRLVSRKKKKH